MLRAVHHVCGAPGGSSQVEIDFESLGRPREILGETERRLGYVFVSSGAKM